MFGLFTRQPLTSIAATDRFYAQSPLTRMSDNAARRRDVGDEQRARCAPNRAPWRNQASLNRYWLDLARFALDNVGIHAQYSFDRKKAVVPVRSDTAAGIGRNVFSDTPFWQLCIPAP